MPVQGSNNLKRHARDIQYRLNNKAKIALINKKYYTEHKEQIKIKRNYHLKQRRKTDNAFKIEQNYRRRLREVIKNKKDKSINLLGCTVNELKKHLECNFSSGMNWNNYGIHGWHIDHITPCCAFDLTSLEEQRKCFHYTNLQPMWALDNIKKGGR